jgi:RND family efflux transporter MFP subunit
MRNKGIFKIASTVLLSVAGMNVKAADLPSLDEAQLSCLLEPSTTVELSSSVQGVIKTITAQRGDKVKKGQVVMTLDSTVEQAALDTVTARLEFATRKVKRNADLFGKKLISENEQDEVLTEQRLAAFQMKEARVRLSQRKTQSPISGVVVERLKEAGEFVDETPFLKIVSLNPMHAEVVLPAEYYGRLQRGNEVTLFTNREEGFSGKIKIIDPIIDAASNTFAVTVELDNNNLELAAGLRCRVSFAN